ncbi:farnesyl diphosphate synthase [uncultured Desulfosarcina sp.]|uniref:polyprenyl synthetase family protein n=1 Tax=uncultured Desulfosarcina sp. TaxID=218289 RepID=UPI0029C85D86|nr:farnesyl diphosphate synthase [uncultured Desulfosarcina sp.]
MFDLKSYLKIHRQRVNASLHSYLGTGDSDVSRVTQAMSYSVMAGGKRLRPILCIAGAQAVEGDQEAVTALACALEMIHTYSLIHDDLPAMDDDEKRRGKATCHVRFDEATALLAGDALLTLAFKILATTASQFPAAEHLNWLNVIAKIASASGFRGMIEGQMRDMASEGKIISIEDLEILHGLKTGKLIEASVVSGATIAGATEIQLQALSAYAVHIGLAFQVADDILNVTGDPERLGKNTGTDQARGKNTYPSLIGLEPAQRLADRLVDKALNALDDFDKKADPLRAIARYIVERNR